MKKIILLITILSFTLIGWAQIITIDGIKYELGTPVKIARVIAGGNSSGEIRIPTTINYAGTGYFVTAIGDHAFDSCTSLTGVHIPEMVEYIGHSAFRNCTSLNSVSIDEGPNGSNMRSISPYAFYNCTSLYRFQIPSSLFKIEMFAFAKCHRLISVTIPSSLISIGEYAFWDSSPYLDVDPNNPNYSSKDGVLYNKNQSTLIHCPTSTKGELIIPSSVSSIESHAFDKCVGLTSVTIPSTVTSIGDQAFRDCRNLNLVNIPDSITSIGNAVFYNCKSLISVTIPSKVTTIGDYAFYGCEWLFNATISSSVTSIGYAAFAECYHLSRVNIPDSVTSIGDAAFFNCYYLKSITIPSSITSIGEAVFYNCQFLTSVTIPSSVTSIGKYAFALCRSLTSVTIPSSVSLIGEYAFGDCSSLKLINSLISTPMNLSSNHFIGIDKADCVLHVPVGTKPLYQSATGWQDFNNITEFLVLGSEFTVEGITYSVNGINTVSIKSRPSFTGTNIPKNVTYMGIEYNPTSIENNVFEYYNKFIDITVPTTITTIGDFSFNACPNLKSIELPSALQYIGNNSFNNCTSLSIIKVNSTIPPTLGTDVFSQVDKFKCTLYVPLGSLSLYKSANQWKDFINIIEYTPLGIEKEAIQTWYLYPNPTRDYINISGLQNGIISIYDFNGKLVVNLKLNGNDKIDFQNFLSGVYLYRIQSPEGIQNGKIIKE